MGPREAILRVVREHPGISLTDLRARLGDEATTSLYHHVRRLAAEGAVRVVRAGRRNLLVAGDAPAPDERALRTRAQLRGGARRVAEAVVQGAVNAEQVARRAGLSPRRASEHLRRLRDEGLISSSSPHRYERLRASPQLQHLLDSAASARPTRGGETDAPAPR